MTISHMPTTIVPEWEREIAKLLDELSAVQEELLEVLREKRKLIAANDLDGMRHLQAREEVLSERLTTCHDSRANLLKRAEASGMPGDSITRLATAVAGSARSPLNQQVRQLNGRMGLLQHHSLANWVLAQRSLLHISQLLEIIATGGRLRPTYGKSEPVLARGALVDQEA